MTALYYYHFADLRPNRPPKFKVGEWVEIETGPYEGFRTPIRLRIWNKAHGPWVVPGWFYMTNYGCQREANLTTRVQRKRLGGYCDLPGRGY